MLQIKEEISEKADPYLQQNLYVKVALDIPVGNGCFYYQISEEVKKYIAPGQIVLVPFKNQERTGTILEVFTKEQFIEQTKELEKLYIKLVYYVFNDISIFDKNYILLAQWISNYYLTNIGTVLSASGINDLVSQKNYKIRYTGKEFSESKLSEYESIVLQGILRSKIKELSIRQIILKSKLNKIKAYEAINSLKDKDLISGNIVLSKRQITTADFSPAKVKSQQLVLNKEQQYALNTVINLKEPETFLLHGITGSGKTEVYLQLIDKVLKQGKSVLYLLPEIYLIPQALQGLSDRFDNSSIILWHSSLSENEKQNSCIRLLQTQHKSKIILGARSAILAPICNIGLIVIDEAHDYSYKQASPAPRYDAVTVARKKSEIENCPVILGTATPNISDYFKCLKDHTVLKLTKRIENYPMPKVYIVDMKNEFPVTNKNVISNVLKSSISEALSKKEQIILLLNRRGYSSHVFCRVCSFIQKCKNCSVPLVYHKNLNSMLCHHCGYELNTFHTCPECKSPHFKYFGLGTQQLEEEAKKIFPSARIIRVDKDQLRKKDQYLTLWQEFSSGQADILIGTQLVAKGLDLPNVTVVGVILADTMLNFPDHVSYERAFQLLTQVTGRTGRGNKPGRVFIQTYQSENPIFKYIENHDYENFYNTEIEQRKAFEYPPFTNLLRIIFQSEDEKLCLEHANETLKKLSSSLFPPLFGSFLGPAPCFFTKLHGKYRYHVLCKTHDYTISNLMFNQLLQKINKNVKVDMIIDVDSLNLL